MGICIDCNSTELEVSYQSATHIFSRCLKCYKMITTLVQHHKRGMVYRKNWGTEYAVSCNEYSGVINGS